MDAAQVTILDCLVSPYLAWEKNVALSHQLIMLKLGILALMCVTTCFSFLFFLMADNFLPLGLLPDVTSRVLLTKII